MLRVYIGLILCLAGAEADTLFRILGLSLAGLALLWSGTRKLDRQIQREENQQ